MMTPIHILCENFTEIGRWKVGEMMRCFTDTKGSQNALLSPLFSTHLAEGTKTFQEVATCTDISV